MTPPYNKFRHCAILLLGLGWMTSCERSGTEGRGEHEREEVLAMVGGRAITRAAFEKEWQARLERNPFLRADAGTRQRVLEGMIEEAAWMDRAQAEGFDRRPEIRSRIDRLVAGAYREAALAKRLEAMVPPDEERIAGYYDGHLAEFTVPASVRAGVILIRTRPNALPEKRQEARVRAESVWREAVSTSDKAYVQLVQRSSEDQATRYTGGDTGWLSAGDGAGRWPPVVAEAALGLKQPGELAPLVESSEGFHIVRLSARRVAHLRPLDEVRDSIAYRLARQDEAAVQAALLEDLTQGLEITINQGLLDSIALSGGIQTAAVPAAPGD